MMTIKRYLFNTFVAFPYWVAKLAVMMAVTGTVFYALAYANLYFSGGICQ